MNFGSTSRLGLSLYETSDPIEQWPGQSGGDAAVIIRSVYKQVLGNAHIMDSERLVSVESKFTDGELSVREFVRAVGKSSLYASLFCDRPRFRQIELGYKHFLGRAPNSYSEMQAGTAILDSGSFDDLIDFFVDSEEYKSTYGDDTVPYIRGYKTEALSTNAGFSYMFDLLRGPATSDAATASALNAAISKEQPRSVSIGYRKPIILPYSPPAGYQLPTTPAPTATPAAPAPVAPAFAASGGTFRAVTTQPSADIAASASSRLGYAPYANSTPIEVWPGQSDADKQVAIRAAYKQVLGNAHVMDSERLVVPESQFKRGELSLREFVRAIGKSDLYQARFGDCSRFRKIELAYKHFLGRAPNDYSEMQACTAILDSGTFNDLIDYFVDSDEFQAVFGQDTVPFIRGYATEASQTAAGFPYTLQLLTGPASSDIGAASRLNASIINATPELPVSRYPVPTTGAAPAARPAVPVGAPGQAAAGTSGQAPLFSGDTAGKLGFFGRILNFVEQLTGGEGSGDAATAEQPKEEFFLNPDDARSLGDVEYMRAPRTIKRTFPNAADPEKPLEFEAVVTASEKVISPEKDKPTGLPSVTPAKAKDVKIPVVTPTTSAPAQASVPAPAVSASLMEIGTTASRAGKSGPYVSMSMSPEVSLRRKKDNSLDMFRKMATDLRRSE